MGGSKDIYIILCEKLSCGDEAASLFVLEVVDQSSADKAYIEGAEFLDLIIFGNNLYGIDACFEDIVNICISDRLILNGKCISCCGIGNILSGISSESITPWIKR